MQAWSAVLNAPRCIQFRARSVREDASSHARSSARSPHRTHNKKKHAHIDTFFLAVLSTMSITALVEANCLDWRVNFRRFLKSTPRRGRPRGILAGDCTRKSPCKACFACRARLQCGEAALVFPVVATPRMSTATRRRSTDHCSVYNTYYLRVTRRSQKCWNKLRVMTAETSCFFSFHT